LNIKSKIKKMFSHKILENVLVVFLFSLTIIFLVVAIWEMEPFYNYSTENEAIFILTRTVLKIHETIFQFSQDLYIIYAYIWIVFAITRYLVGAKNKQKMDEDEVEDIKIEQKNWKIYILHLFLLTAITLIVFMYRYMVLWVPQGFDTAWYTYILKKMQQDPMQILKRYWNRSLALLIMFSITLVFRMTPENLMVLLTPLIGILYVIGVYFLVLTGTKNRLLSLLAALYAPLTYATIRLSLDLYSNYIAWTLTMYALSLYIRTIDLTKIQIKYIVVTSTLLMGVALTHVWAFMFVTAVIFVYNLLEITIDKSFGKNLQKTLIIYAPTIIFVAYKPRLILGTLKMLRLFLAPDKWEYTSQENPYILILAIIGIITLMNQKQTSYTKLLISWLIVTSTTMITALYYWPYRLMCLMPIAILAAHGTQTIIRKIKTYLNIKSIENVVFPLLIFLVCFTAMLPHAYIPDHVFRPPDDVMQQLYWIEQHYGFENRNIIVCIDICPPSISGEGYSNYYKWAIATVGNIVYDAPLLHLLQNLPDEHNIRYKGIAEKIIVIPDKLYQMSPLEYQITEKISELGIYRVKVKDLTQIGQVIKNSSIWMEDSFRLEEWKVISGYIDFKHQILSVSGVLNISLTPLYPNKCLTIERWLSEPLYQTRYLIMKVQGEVDSLDFIVEVWSDTQWLAGVNFKKYLSSTKYTYLVVKLSPDMPIWRIRIAFQNQNIISTESHVQIDYIALI